MLYNLYTRTQESISKLYSFWYTTVEYTVYTIHSKYPLRMSFVQDSKHKVESSFRCVRYYCMQKRKNGNLVVSENVSL